MADKRRTRVLFVLAVVCVAALLGDKFIWRPLWANLRSTTERRDRLTVELQQAKEMRIQGSKWRNQVEEMKKMLLPVVPAEAESLVLNAVDEWSRDTGLTVTSLRPRWKRRDNRTAYLELLLSGEGRLDEVTAFLFELEAAPMALALEEVELIGSEKRGAGMRLTVRISARLAAGEEKDEGKEA